MKKLKYVRQLDYQGCSIACMAMIVGMKYFELREFLWNSRKRVDFRYNGPKGMSGQIGLYEGEFKDVLEKLFDIKTRAIQFQSIGKLRKHCLLLICRIDDMSNRHYLVFDAKARKILDPSGCVFNNKLQITKDADGRSPVFSDYNVSHCLEIQ